MSSARTLPIELNETAETQTAVLVNASLTTPASAPHNGHTLIALAVIACIANASWTVTGFGAGIVFQIGWQIAYIIGVGTGEIKMGVLCSAVMQIFMSAIQGFLLRKNSNTRLVCYLAIPSCMFVVIGLEALFTIHGDLVKRFLGVIFMTLAAQRAVSLIRKAMSGSKEDLLLVIDADTPCSIKVAAMSAGGASGLMAGMFGLPGPALMVFVSFFNIEYTVWRASNARVRGCLILTLLSYAAIRGELKVGDWQMYVTVVVAGTFGVGLGTYLATCISQSMFPVIILVTLFYGALLMLTSGTTHGAQEGVALFVAGTSGLAVLVGFVKFVSRLWHQRMVMGPSKMIEVVASPKPSFASEDDLETASSDSRGVC
jgi:uncharacterized membrane protein YfcA